MTFEAAKEKLHKYLDRAGEDKVMAIYTLVSSEIERETFYDEETLKMIMQRREDVMSGKVKTYSLEESKERIRQFRERNGV
jgi:hypothetical protein